MIIRRKIYWHAAVIFSSSGDYDPTLPAVEQDAASTLQQDGDVTDAWLLNSASDFIYGVKNCKKISASLHILNDEVQDVDTNNNTMGLRADNPLVSSGEVRFVLPPDTLNALLGEPVEISTASDLLSLEKKPVRYRLFAVYKSGSAVSCSDRSVPDAWFDSESIPEEVVPFNDGASRAAMEAAMGPISDLSPSNGETGFYVKIKRYDSITRIGCCGINATGVSASSSSSSSSIPGTDSCPTSALPSYSSDANEYRIWMVRQNVNNKIHGDAGVAELAYADLSSAIDSTFGSINPSLISWNHAGFINFEDVQPRVYDSLANPLSYGNQSGERSRARMLTPDMFDLYKSMPVHLQHISWDNRGFLWALCSGGFKMLPSNNPAGATQATFTTTEGVYRLIPGGWYYATSSTYSWGGGGSGTRVGASLVEPLIGKFNQVAAGYVESNASPYTAFNIFLDDDGMIHVRAEGLNTTNVRSSFPDFNANGVRFSEIDAGNGMICAVSTTGKLFAWNMISPADATNYASNQLTVAAVSASTDSYVHCCVSLTSPCAFIVASRQDGNTVDRFNSSGKTSAFISIPAGGIVRRLSAGNAWSAAYYTDSAGVGKISTSGTINGISLSASTIIGTKLNNSNVVDMDGGYDYLAVCYLPTDGSVTDPYVRTFTAPAATNFMIPDDLRMLADTVQGSRVYAGYDRLIYVDKNNQFFTRGADHYAYAAYRYHGTGAGDVQSLGIAIANGVHFKDGVNGTRKYAVMVAGHPKDLNGGSVSIFVKYLPDASTGTTLGQNPTGDWKFLKKIYATAFTIAAGKEFGSSVCVAGNNDIIVGVPGARKVCVIRKISGSIDYSAHSTIDSPTASPISLAADNRFGDKVSWIPVGSAYGMILISAPTITDSASPTANGAIIASAYSDTGVVDSRKNAIRITDVVSGSFSGSRFGADFDACIPKIDSDSGIVPGRYNLVASDTVYNKVIQLNCVANATSLISVVGSADVIDAPANYASAIVNSTISVQYTHHNQSLNENQSQLALSWTNDFRTLSSGSVSGNAWVLNPQIDNSLGCMNYDSNLNNAQSLVFADPPFVPPQSLIHGVQIIAEDGLLVISSLQYTSLTQTSQYAFNYFSIYGYEDEKATSSYGKWKLIKRIINGATADYVTHDKFFADTGVLPLLTSLHFNKKCNICFDRENIGFEILSTGYAPSTNPHKSQGWINIYPIYNYPIGQGRKIADISQEHAAVPVKCAAAGLRHQVLVAADNEYYRIPKYLDARLCTASPIYNDDNISTDQNMQIAVPSKDPITGQDLDEDLYHFGSIAAFMMKAGSIGSDYKIFDLPIYSSISKTIRVADTHWKPFKVLDKPIDYDTLSFEGYAKFKPKCDPVSPPINLIEGQSGAFNPPRIDTDGTADADIDNFETARNMINTAQVFYKGGASGSAASYINTIVGAVSPSNAINSPSNANNPLDGNAENIDFVRLYCSFSWDTTYDGPSSPQNQRLSQWSYLYDIKHAYHGHFRQNLASSSSYPSSTERYGFTAWAHNDTADSQELARKIVWNSIGEKTSDINGRLKLYVSNILCSYLQPCSANKSDLSLYASTEWHNYLSHPTDTAHRVSILERQSIDANASGINNPLAYNAIYGSAGGDYSKIPTHNFFATNTTPSPYNAFLPLDGANGSVTITLSSGRLYKRSFTISSRPKDSDIYFYDFTGRGAGILVSHRGTRVAWSGICWPVLRNQLSLLGGYNFHVVTPNNPPERSSGFAPGWSGDIITDKECIADGMTKFFIAAGTASSYGLVTGQFVLSNSNPNITSSNSQIGYLYSLKYIQEANGTRHPVDLSSGDSFVVPPALHATGCSGIYIENAANPAAGELLILSSATFSCGQLSSESSGLMPARQHVWLQKRSFNGSAFSSSSPLLDVATTLPVPTDVPKLRAEGWEFTNKQASFHSIANSGMRFGSNTLLKTVQNHTSINVWNIGSASDPIAIVAIGGRAFSMRRNAAGASALSQAVSELSAITTSLNGIMSSVIEKPIDTGFYYNIWVSAFDNQVSNPALNFSRTVSHSVPSQNATMAVALGSGIPFYINGVAHVWYAGYVFKIESSIANTASSIGGVVITDVTSAVLETTADVLGNGSALCGDYIQGFVSGYSNGQWLVVSNTREENEAIRIYRINSSTGKLEFDSFISSSSLGLSFNLLTNTPYRLGTVINSSGSVVSVCNHQFSNEISTNDEFSNEYKTGYSNPDVVGVFARLNNQWIPSGSIVSSDISSSNNRSITSFAESITLNENDNLLIISSGSDLAVRTISSGSDLSQAYYLSNTDARRKRPSKLHAFNLNPQASASDVGECNNLVSFSTPGFTGSAYANLNFWSAVPLTARNGSQSMVFSSSDSAMYISTLGEMLAIGAKKEGSWKIAAASNTAKQTVTMTAFKYPYPAGSCFGCGVTLANNLIMPKAPRVKPGLVSGNVSDGKRAMAYRASAAPSILSIDAGPAVTGASVGISDLVDTYGSNGSVSAPYFTKLNEKTQVAEWDQTNGYKLSYNPSTRSFIKRYELKTSSGLTGVGLPILNSEIIGSTYKASFANCPPVWDEQDKKWNWSGVRGVNLSSSPVYYKTISSMGPFGKLDYSDVFGLSCFQFNTSYIYALRETVRDIVSTTDDTDQLHVSHISNNREDCAEASGTDTSSRNGQLILIKSPTDPASVGSIISSIELDDFFTSGTGSRFMMNGPASVTIGATNASASARDTAIICKSGFAPYARNRSASPVGSVLILIDDGSSMNDLLPQGFRACQNDRDDIPSDVHSIMPFEVMDDIADLRYKLYGKDNPKYAIDNESPLYRASKFNRIMRSVLRMMDPKNGDLLLGDQVVISCASAISSTNPTSQSIPSASSGKISPLLCVCQSDLVSASMRAATWKPQSSEDIFTKIIKYNPDGTYARGSVFDIVSPPSNSIKFDHVIIAAGSFSVPASVSANVFADNIYNEITKIGAQGLLKNNGNIHVVDISPDDKRAFKEALGSYGTYSIWRGGGM